MSGRVRNSGQCCIEGCEKIAESRGGMCGMHAQRMRRYGDPNYVTPESQRRANNRVAQLERFDDVKKSTYRKFHGKHEHRAVVETGLGRPLARDEIVHHIDGDKHNNDPSNLTVMTRAEHAREHWWPSQKKIEWNGRSQYPTEWANEFEIPYYIFYNRTRAGWSMDRIATTPVKHCKKRQ